MPSTLNFVRRADRFGTRFATRGLDDVATRDGGLIRVARLSPVRSIALQLLSTLELLKRGPYGLSDVKQVGAHTFTALYGPASGSFPVLVQLLDGGNCSNPAVRYACRVLTPEGVLLELGEGTSTPVGAIDQIGWASLTSP